MLVLVCSGVYKVKVVVPPVLDGHALPDNVAIKRVQQLVSHHWLFYLQYTLGLKKQKVSLGRKKTKGFTWPKMCENSTNSTRYRREITL